ncbi:hypothetical protein TNCV_1584061 [Trichonephila clavipes]|nr:hypothetical protein TNCV_1584061 [Trichonephila clavipes]
MCNRWASFHGIERCVNCSQSHPSDSKLCSKWKTEKEIQIIKTNSITYLEARKLIAPPLSQSYSQVTKLSTTTTTTQTDENITKIVFKIVTTIVSVPKFSNIFLSRCS